MVTLTALITPPPFRYGFAVRANLHDLLAGQLERQSYPIRELIAGDNSSEVYPKMHNRLSNRGADACDYARRAEQANRCDCLYQIICHLRINRRHARDVEDGNLRAGPNDALKQPLHHQLSAAAVERSDQRQAD